MPELLEARCDLRRVAFIFNPASGIEDPVSRRARLEALAYDAGLPCELTETEVERGATPLAERAVADGMERVLVSGGDGTVAEAAAALAGTPVALAVVPGGTGNLLAVNLGLPTQPEAAMRLALTGRPHPTDVGRANGHAFLIMAGMGADARMIRDADRELKNRLGALAYFVAALKQIRRPRAPYTITIDGRRIIRRSAQTVMVANMGRITGGVSLLPEAAPESGRIEVAILRARSFREFLQVGIDTLLRRPRQRALLEVHRGREIVIETRRPQPVQIDGNALGSTTRLEVRVEPGALLLVRPEPGAELPALPSLLPTSEAARRWVPWVVGAAVAGGTAYLLWRKTRAGRKTG